jgi:hypothetical protein
LLLEAEPGDTSGDPVTVVDDVHKGRERSC